MTHSQSSREQRRRADIAELEAMYAQAEASEQFYRQMQADVEREAFRRAAAEHRAECKRGRLWWACWRVADWVLRRFGA